MAFFVLCNHFGPHQSSLLRQSGNWGSTPTFLLEGLLMRFALFFLVTFIVTVATTAGGEPDKISKALKDECWGTVFEVREHADQIHTNAGFYYTARWDSAVELKACRWAGGPGPNLTIEVAKDGDKMVMKRIYSVAQPWGKGKILTPMEEVAREYTGRPPTRKELNRLTADMRTAYHEYFSDRK